MERRAVNPVLGRGRSSTTFVISLDTTFLVPRYVSKKEKKKKEQVGERWEKEQKGRNKKMHTRIRLIYNLLLH